MRIREARILLDHKEWSGAYYLAGYAVKCGLKVCIAREFRQYCMPDLQLVKDGHTHDLAKLVNLADLKGALAVQESSDPAFAANWSIVKDWNESSRYRVWNESEARNLYKAISQRGHGVLPWVRRNW
ncbi:hypothetical protein Nocox_02915 [Nonomuraea coxensis DSM 45129]|uniref:HEPN domain-containing protein n=1 Tax=Nonomuraea coxensis DSM 45129 TaxID=1122611 RepID=A0ABX8TSV9_9ACTN|nr:hypothetical protein [Nonomuraea coxensis]QYC38213.1 hypothetical protein Nocox_02915 [Nonomuraea coxensis DSM 45129]